MAKSTGKFGSLSELKPLQGDIATDILNREDQQFKHREEQRINEDRVSAKKLAERNELKDAMELYTALKIPITGSESIDEINTKTIMVASERQNVLIDMMANQDKYSKEEIISAYGELKNIKMLPDSLLAMSKAQIEEKAAYDEKVKSGKLFRNEDYEKRFQGDYKNIGVVLKNGMPVTIFRKGNSDINGDGKIDEFDYETMGSLSDASQRPEFTDRYDFKSTIKAHADGIGKKVNSMVGKDGYTINTVTGLTEDVLQQTVKGALYGADGNPTGLMKSFLKEDGLDINNPKHQEQIYNKYETELRMAMDSGTLTDPNNSDRIAASRLALAQREEKRAIAKDQSGLSGFTPATDKDGNVLISKKTDYKTDGLWTEGWKPRETRTGKIFTTDITKEKPMLIEDAYMTIEEVEISDSGDVVVTGVSSEKDVVKGGWTNTRVEISDERSLNTIAKAKGYNNYNEFSQDLLKKENEKFSADNEKLIKDNMSANPGYSREEIIAALKLKQ